jgi:hypothetical protein
LAKDEEQYQCSEKESRDDGNRVSHVVNEVSN